MTTEPAYAHPPLTSDEIRLIDAWWRAANYLSVGQIYLLANPLLREPLRPEHVKPRLLGHWGTTPGLNFIYVHLNRAIKARDLDAIYITGPGHGGPGLVASAYLDSTYTDVYPHIGPDEQGIQRLFRQFSFPGGIPSHVLGALLEGYGYAPRFVEGSEPEAMHQQMAATLDEVLDEIAAIQHHARQAETPTRPRWPMIVLVTPKGWTGPKEVDGLPAEGSFRSHQVPLAEVRTNPGHLAQLEEWMRSYRPEELFEESGAIRPEVTSLAPEGQLRMSA